MSTRSNGGIIGPQNRTTSAYANGVWHLYDNQQSVLAKNWPGFVPVAPSPPAVGTVTLGSGTLNALLTATIPFTQGYNGGNAITKVTAISIPGGLTANTNGSSPITISGLSSNTNYVFGIFETNYYGDSPYGYSNPVQTASVPSTPTIGTATVIDATSANVTFTASSSNGGTPITGYTAISTPGNITGTSNTSPIVVSGLSPLTTYLFNIYASNLIGNSALSSSSNSITTPAFLPQMLVVAGGGGGSGGADCGAGGGAGGLINSSFSITTGVTYSVAVGGGSAGVTGAIAAKGTSSSITGTGLGCSFIGSIASGNSSFVGSISGTVLTVTSISSGTIYPGQVMYNLPVPYNYTMIMSQISGTPGGVGTYSVSQSQSRASTTINTSYTGILTVTSVTSGSLAVGQLISGSGVDANTVILQFISGSGGIGTYLVFKDQTISSSLMTSTFTAIGGGGGGPMIGGSGSGGPASGTSYQGYPGILSQGNSGGNNQASPPYPGGGGGGAGGIGGNGVAASSQGGAGGSGLTTSISGSSVTYAGGGGSGGTVQGANPGAGGSGGGGSGGNGNNSIPPTNAVANTGGGGGGAGNAGAYLGSNGGSGVVIIKSTLTAVATTGSPTVTTSGGFVIYTFTGNGSIRY